MKVYFIQNVKGLGRMGEVKEVNDGFAQNFLIPKKLVEPATAEKIAKIDNVLATKSLEQQVRTDLLIKTLASLDQKEIELRRKVNSSGGLFGGVHIGEIKEAIKSAHNVSVPDEYLHLNSEIHHTGEFILSIGDKKKLGKEFSMKVKIVGQ